MKIKPEVTVKLTGLRVFSKKLDARKRQAFAKWNLRYRAYIQKRWVKYSRGGGDWPALKYRKGSILRDTSTLFAAMAPTLSPPPGSIASIKHNGVIVGFGGGGSHPGGPTISELAYWHHTGAGNLPERELIVEPDETTLKGMRADMDRVLNK